MILVGQTEPHPRSAEQMQRKQHCGNTVKMKIFTKHCRKFTLGDIPGGPEINNPPASAGDMGSIPGPGTKIPHALEQRNLCATTTEPMCSRVCTKSRHRKEKAPQ